MQYNKEEKNIIKVHEAREKLLDALQREPLPEEIATEVELPLEEVREFLQLKVEPPEKENNHELRFKLTVKNHELEKARSNKKLLQSELAEKVGISNASYCHIECCRVFPDVEIQYKIAQILEKSKESLFPEWLKTFSQKWKDSDRSRVVPINELSLGSPQLLQLDSGDYDKMIEKADASFLVDKLFKHTDRLSPKEKRILELRYGLGDGVQKTLEEVGKEFGVTRDRIRQIEAKAIDKLKFSRVGDYIINNRNK